MNKKDYDKIHTREPKISDLPFRYFSKWKPTKDYEDYTRDEVFSSWKGWLEYKCWIAARTESIEKNYWKSVPTYKRRLLIGQKVHIAKDLCSSMRHFKSNCKAIIGGSYEDLHGKRSYSTWDCCMDHYNKKYNIIHRTSPVTYSLYFLKNGIIFSSSAWYYETQLTLIDSNPIPGLKLILNYNS